MNGLRCKNRTKAFVLHFLDASTPPWKWCLLTECFLKLYYIKIRKHLQIELCISSEFKSCRRCTELLCKSKRNDQKISRKKATSITRMLPMWKLLKDKSLLHNFTKLRVFIWFSSNAWNVTVELFSNECLTSETTISNCWQITVRTHKTSVTSDSFNFKLWNSYRAHKANFC